MAHMNYWDHTFHSEEDTAKNGAVYKVEGRDSLSVEIFSSEANTARIVTFYRKSRNGTLKPIVGFRTSDFQDASSTTGTGEEWQFDTNNAYEIVMDLTFITGGTVTVIGRAS